MEGFVLFFLISFFFFFHFFFFFYFIFFFFLNFILLLLLLLLFHFSDLSPQQNVIASGYVMYGSATVLVMATQGIEGVNGFTLDPSTGEFVLTQQNIETKDFHKIYSVNQGNWKFFNDATKKYIESCQHPESGSPFSLRYIGSMIGDVHRTMLYGGIFMYPGDSRAPKGKLRLLYEVMPMAFIVHKVFFFSLSLSSFLSLFPHTKTKIKRLEELPQTEPSACWMLSPRASTRGALALLEVRRILRMSKSFLMSTRLNC